MKRILSLAALAAASLGLSACGLLEREKTVDVSLSSPPVNLVAAAVGLTPTGSLALEAATTVGSSIAAVDQSDPDIQKYRDDIESVGVNNITLTVAAIGGTNLATEVTGAILTIHLGYAESGGVVTDPGEPKPYRLTGVSALTPWPIEVGNSVVATAFEPVAPADSSIEVLLGHILKTGEPFGVQVTALLDALPVNVAVTTNFGLAMKVKVSAF